MGGRELVYQASQKKKNRNKTLGNWVLSPVKNWKPFQQTGSANGVYLLHGELWHDYKGQKKKGAQKSIAKTVQKHGKIFRVMH